MTTRIALLLVPMFAAVAAGCVQRHPPWQIRGRAPCADLEERVDRDRARIGELESTGKRPDDLVWHRDDLRIASRLLNDCKNRESRARGD